MADTKIFKIPSAQLVGGTGAYGSSLYIYLTPNRPVHFSTDGNLTVNTTVPGSADISYLEQKVDALDITVYGDTATSGLVDRVYPKCLPKC